MSDKRSAWKNWAGTQRCAPQRVERPRTEDELVAIVREAAAAGRRVKMVGAGHSFTGIALTDGVLVRPDRYNAVLAADASTGRVTVQAGISLAKLNDELDARGLAMPNLGDIAYQSIAGAIATATHGTGARIGGIATQVVALRLIAGDGSAIECSPDHEPEVFRAARVGLGALGVVSTVTLQCVPAFSLHAVEASARVDDLIADLDEHIDGNDHFEFFWVPHTGWALAKWNNRTEEPPAPRGRVTEVLNDIVLANVAFAAICRVGRLAPGLTPRLARLVGNQGRSDYVDKSYRVFASPRMVRFHEMEYAIPRAAAAEALNRVRRLVETSGLRVSFPVEVRFTAADDIPLSTASGRETCYIAVHMYQGLAYQQYFEGVEAIMNDYGGRPHWGKLHFQTAETLAPRYPEWEAFQSARRRLDPQGTFSNAYLDRVLGRIGD